MEEIVPALAVKLAVVAVAGTMTEAGSVRRLGMAPEMVTETPPVGAAPLKLTVQVALVLEASVGALHCREETKTGASRESVADLEEPLRDAVTVAV